MSKFDDDVVELAKYLYCATMSFQLNITYEESWQRFLSPPPNRPLNNVYLESAYNIMLDKVTRDAVEKLGK